MTHQHLGRLRLALTLSTFLLALSAGVTAAPPKFVFGLALADQDSSFSQELKRGAEDAGQKWGFAFEVRNAAGQAETQKADLAALRSAGVNAIIVQPIDAASLAPALAALTKAGVPAATMVTPVPGGGAVVHINTGYRNVGRLAAEHFQGLVTAGTLLAVGPANPVAVETIAGFETALKGTPLNVVRLSVTTRAQAAETVENWAKTAGAPPAGVFGLAPDLALGALKGLNAVEGGTSVPVVAFGVNPEAQKALKLGRLSALVEEKPWDIGQLAAEVLLGVLNGKRPAAPVIPADPILVK